MKPNRFHGKQSEITENQRKQNKKRQLTVASAHIGHAVMSPTGIPNTIDTLCISDVGKYQYDKW